MGLETVLDRLGCFLSLNIPYVVKDKGGFLTSTVGACPQARAYIYSGIGGTLHQGTLWGGICLSCCGVCVLLLLKSTLLCPDFEVLVQQRGGLMAVCGEHHAHCTTLGSRSKEV